MRAGASHGDNEQGKVVLRKKLKRARASCIIHSVVHGDGNRLLLAFHPYFVCVGGSATGTVGPLARIANMTDGTSPSATNLQP
jgi:hypothetical protein